MKKQFKKIEMTYLDYQKKNEVLQKSLYAELEKENNILKNKINNLEENVQALTASRIRLEDERDVLQEKIDNYKEDMQVATNSYMDIQGKRDNLQKLLDENEKEARKTIETLQNKIDSEKKAHQHYMESAQSLLDIALETLEFYSNYDNYYKHGDEYQPPKAQKTIERIKGKNVKR